METARGIVPLAYSPPAGATWASALFTKSFSSLLGLKKGIFLAGTSTFAPVFGLRPTRPRRSRVRKLPNPRISIFCPCCRDRRSKSGDSADRKSTRLNSSHSQISYAVFCLKKKKKKQISSTPIQTHNPTNKKLQHPIQYRLYAHVDILLTKHHRHLVDTMMYNVPYSRHLH